MELSARNQLMGTVKNVKLGEVMAEVVMSVGDQEVFRLSHVALPSDSRLHPATT